jgi:hypothetical protein
MSGFRPRLNVRCWREAVARRSLRRRRLRDGIRPIADTIKACFRERMSHLSEDQIVRHVTEVLLRLSDHRGQAITPSTELYYELGLAGDDLGDVIDEIRAPFATDFSPMDLRRYAPNEVRHNFGFNLFRAFREWRGERTYRSLTVRSLVDAIQRGAWSDC